MKWHLTILLLTGCLLAADTADEANKKDIAKWQGTWAPTSFIKDDQAAPANLLKNIKLTVKGTDYFFETDQFTERGSYKFNASANPKELDISVSEGPDKGKVYKVIYKVSDDEIVICLEADNKNRPKEFHAKAGTTNVLETWNRVKP